MSFLNTLLLVLCLGTGGWNLVLIVHNQRLRRVIREAKVFTDQVHQLAEDIQQRIKNIGAELAEAKTLVAMLQNNLNIPNLDAMEPAELKEMHQALHHAGGYAICIRLAKECRLAGNLQMARHHEQVADGYYRAIPEKYRW